MTMFPDDKEKRSKSTLSEQQLYGRTGRTDRTCGHLEPFQESDDYNGSGSFLVNLSLNLLMRVVLSDAIPPVSRPDLVVVERWLSMRL
ncbi:hypothetical protein ABVK25_011954 [Lepraria finkii]|uniref:Uncharacterized protein n=1 Tax=Lepraria finkii TaxID=1340010 RepID=A0ABR4AL24_9LECA